MRRETRRARAGARHPQGISSSTTMPAQSQSLGPAARAGGRADENVEVTGRPPGLRSADTRTGIAKPGRHGTSRLRRRADGQADRPSADKDWSVGARAARQQSVDGQLACRAQGAGIPPTSLAAAATRAADACLAGPRQLVLSAGFLVNSDALAREHKHVAPRDVAAFRRK
jgi:hypothetical protein